MRAIVLNATSPYEMPLSKTQQSETWKAFLRSGTVCSAQACTLPYIIRRCEREGINYTLYGRPGKGYYIKRTKDAP